MIGEVTADFRSEHNIVPSLFVEGISIYLGIRTGGDAFRQHG